MKKILFVNACVRPESRTRRLALEVLKKLKGEVTELCLEKENIQPLNGERLAFRNQKIAQGDFSSDLFRYARQFAEADEIVIAAPYWDLSFPSMVKIYFEAVTVTGVTFYYTEEGIPKGLCRAGRILYVTTAGGPVGSLNLGFEYVKGLADAFYGIRPCLCVKADNLDLVGNDPEEMIREKIEEIRQMEF